MQSNPYQKLRGNNKLNIQANQVTMPSPVREGVELKFRMVVINQSDIASKTYKCPYNHRSADHLTYGSVLDILPEIEKEKRNQHPAYGCTEAGGRIAILAGMRRRKAVSLVEGGKFYILVCDDMTEEEKAAFAKTSDDYEKPSNLDVGLSMAEYKQTLAQKGEKVTQQQLADIFKISTGQVSENLKFTELPSELFTLFPSLNMISYRFLRSMLSYHKNGEAAVRTVVNTAVENGMRVTATSNATKDDLEKQCKALEAELLTMLSSKPKSQKNTAGGLWQAVKPIEHVKVKENKSGSINITIDAKKVDSKTLEKIRKLISQ